MHGMCDWARRLNRVFATRENCSTICGVPFGRCLRDVADLRARGRALVTFKRGLWHYVTNSATFPSTRNVAAGEAPTDVAIACHDAEHP